ncbi:LysR substrate-binding domain-containing protein, partial [Mycolicibacterium sphagni]|uniref:LysR substrate-binding domain-containing protein n=1 Tax=Mycolicibacterium sphagni TaxID=1786 RepID=UPI0021F29227
MRASEGWVPTETGQTVITAAEEIERALGRLGQTGQVATVVRVGAPDGLSSFCVAPAMARLARERPQFSFELISATPSWRQTRSDLDIEIVIGRPEVNNRADMVHVRDYSLALYATEAYLQEHGEPESLLDLTNHTVIYYIDSALQVDDLDKATDLLPQSAKAIRSTSVHVHVQSTVASAGIGLLPDYLAEREPGLRPVLHHQF